MVSAVDDSRGKTTFAQPPANSRLLSGRRWNGLRQFARNKLSVLGSFMLLVLMLAASVGPWIVSADPLEQELGRALQPPSLQHLCGTDQLGRDICARLIHGTRTSLSFGILSVFLGTITGTSLGLLAGYREGWIDSLIMRTMDVMFA